MSLEAYRSRLRALEHLARKLATPAECSGSRQPEPIQISLHFHTGEVSIVCEATAVGLFPRARFRPERLVP
jgi:hypothetical protein